MGIGGLGKLLGGWGVLLLIFFINLNFVLYGF